MKELWVVVGQCGEYSDRTDWYVCAYDNQKDAEWHTDEAMQEARRLQPKRHDGEVSNPYDPHMQTSYTGTDYYAARVPLLSSRAEATKLKR